MSKMDKKWQQLQGDKEALSNYLLEAPLHEVIQYRDWELAQGRKGRVDTWLRCEQHGETCIPLAPRARAKCSTCGKTMKRITRHKDTAFFLKEKVPRYYDQSGKPIMSGGTIDINRRDWLKQQNKGR